ncbi:hypothetical protein M0804_013888 [Polistes exclamans]|nr:hypothetical protein M0804_013888 [Polistes exclamans]
MLHDPGMSSAYNCSIIRAAGNNSILTLGLRCNRQLIKTTAIAKVFTPVLTYQARLFIDPGSELTFVSEQLISQLNIKQKRSKRKTQTHDMVHLTVKSIYTSSKVTVQAQILKTVSSILPSFQSHNQKSFILRADSHRQIVKPNIIKGSRLMPIAQSSIFGRLALDLVHSTPSSSHQAHPITTHVDETEQQDLLTKFWIQEEISSDTLSAPTPEERESSQATQRGQRENTCETAGEMTFAPDAYDHLEGSGSHPIVHGQGLSLD